MALTQTYHAEKPGFLFGIFSSFYSGLSRISEANWRVREAERLNAMTDAALAEKGLKREDIVRHVFRDVYWQ